MKLRVIEKSMLSLGIAFMAGFPIGSAWATSAVTRHVDVAQAEATLKKAAKARTFVGPAVSSRYGMVQVSIAVKSKKITSVRVANSPDSGRSVEIESQAIPLLRQETLRAQSAKIDLVSGATQTSADFISSLQGAVKKARHAKALK